jgi:hypothetical protein
LVVVDMRKVFGIAALSLGLALVVGAALVSWVIAPRLTVLPGDTNALRVYGGQASIMVNPTSLTGTTFGPGILRNVPVELWHHTQVTKTDGDAALVSDGRSVRMAGFTIADLEYLFGVDRTTMQADDSFPEAPPHEGLTFNWPIGTEQHDYTGWVVDVQRTTHMNYVGEGTRGGLPVYIFQTKVPTSEIRDPQLLELLPPTLTKEQVLELTPSLQLPTEKLLELQKVLDRLPDPVPMKYTYSLEATYWIAPDTGIVIDSKRHEVRTANFVDGDKLVPATPIMDMSYQATPTSLAAAVQDARDGADQIHLIRTTVPTVALISGIVLCVIGVVLLVWRRRSRPPVAAEPASPTQPDVPQPRDSSADSNQISRA